MRLTFFGAAGEVTGSCTQLGTSQASLLVDFGLHQGPPEVERRNERFPEIDFESLDAIVLTHAHLDHCGRLPLLAKNGFEGPIYATRATIDLCDILLRDAASIQESDAERLSRRRMRRGKAPVQPLYTGADAEAILTRFVPVDYEEPREVAPGVTARFIDAGHILGSASVELVCNDGSSEKTVVFSGDVGVRGTPLLRDPQTFDHADVLVLESTYGDRDHRSIDDTLSELTGILERAAGEGGKILIPAFAVGRTQNLIFYLGQMRRAGILADLPVYVDSPMATETTELYRSHREVFDEQAWAIINAGQSPLSFSGLHFTRSPDESKALNALEACHLIISAAGMMSGGRILHHLKHALWKESTHLIVVGYQAKGTLGRRIVDGAKSVRIMGEPVAVRAHLHTLGGLSAHAGKSGLVEWASSLEKSNPRVLLNHGENAPRAALAKTLHSELGYACQTPEFGQSFEF